MNKLNEQLETCGNIAKELNEELLSLGEMFSELSDDNFNEEVNGIDNTVFGEYLVAIATLNDFTEGARKHLTLLLEDESEELLN